MTSWDVFYSVLDERGVATSPSKASLRVHLPLRGAPKLILLDENGDANVDSARACITLHEPGELQYAVKYESFETGSLIPSKKTLLITFASPNNVRQFEESLQKKDLQPALTKRGPALGNAHTLRSHSEQDKSTEPTARSSQPQNKRKNRKSTSMPKGSGKGRTTKQKNIEQLENKGLAERRTEQMVNALTEMRKSRTFWKQALSVAKSLRKGTPSSECQRIRQYLDRWPLRPVHIDGNAPGRLVSVGTLPATSTTQDTLKRSLSEANATDDSANKPPKNGKKNKRPRDIIFKVPPLIVQRRATVSPSAKMRNGCTTAAVSTLLSIALSGSTTQALHNQTSIADFARESRSTEDSAALSASAQPVFTEWLQKTPTYTM